MGKMLYAVTEANTDVIHTKNNMSSFPSVRGIIINARIGGKNLCKHRTLRSGTDREHFNVSFYSGDMARTMNTQTYLQDG